MSKLSFYAMASRWLAGLDYEQLRRLDYVSIIRLDSGLYVATFMLLGMEWLIRPTTRLRYRVFCDGHEIPGELANSFTDDFFRVCEEQERQWVC